MLNAMKNIKMSKACGSYTHRVMQSYTRVKKFVPNVIKTIEQAFRNF